MLIRLRLQNLLSFQNEVDLNLIATAERRHSHHIKTAKNRRKDLRILRFAALYGANAAGKSNLVRALAFAQHLITHGTPAHTKIPVPQFRLNPTQRDQPAQISIEFQSQGKIYEYGFDLDRDCIQEEWLWQRTKTTETHLFTRTTDPSGLVTVTYGPFFQSLNPEEQQFFSFIAKGTRPNQLFLRETLDRNLPHFQPVYHWFQNTLTIINPNSAPLTLELEPHQDFQAFFNQMLQAADMGIHQISLAEVAWDSPEGHIARFILEQSPECDRAAAVYIRTDQGHRLTVVQDNDRQKLLKVITLHPDTTGKTLIPFDIAEESDGTQRLLDFIPMLQELLLSETEKVFIVDEVGRSLHPQLSRLIADLHLQPAQQHTPTQLIITTHETHLLDLDLLRRDEIWFLEKQADGATDLYSLADFPAQTGRSIAKSYLQGRYGGIPFLGKAQLLKRQHSHS